MNQPTPATKNGRSRRADRFVFCISGVLLGLGVGMLVSIIGCDEQSSTPPQQQGGGLAQDPKSLPGRSAKLAKDTRQLEENRQSQAVGMSNEMSGESGKFQVGGMEFYVSTAWKNVKPANPDFVAAEFRVPGEGGEAKITMSQVKGGEEMINKNIERWADMLIDPTTGAPPITYPKKIKVSGFPVTRIDLEGTIKAGTMGGPKEETPSYAIRGALIEGPQGLCVIKFMGPKSTIDTSAFEWDTFIQGMKKVERK